MLAKNQTIIHTNVSLILAKSITRSSILNVKIKNERSKIRFYKYFGLFPNTIFKVYKNYFENGLRKEIETLVQTNFRSFVFHFNIQNVAPIKLLAQVNILLLLS